MTLQYFHLLKLTNKVFCFKSCFKKIITVNYKLVVQYFIFVLLKAYKTNISTYTVSKPVDTLTFKLLNFTRHNNYGYRVVRSHRVCVIS